MSFTIFGDSMDDGSKESIEEGTIVTGRMIARSLWKSKFHLNAFPDYIIVHKTDGVICKRITNHDTTTGTITCHSLNPKYKDYVVKLDDCMQVFNIVQVSKPR